MFKEYVFNDISNVFINVDEHGETAELNGATVNIVQDNDRLAYKIRKDYDGLIVGDILFYISSVEYAKVKAVHNPPRADDVVTYNGKPATITSVVSNVGIYEIVLQFAGARNGY